MEMEGLQRRSWIGKMPIVAKPKFLQDFVALRNSLSLWLEVRGRTAKPSLLKIQSMENKSRGILRVCLELVGDPRGIY